MERLNRIGFCRRFLNGDCPYGEVCRYRHERPTRLCRHFQKGVCWYGSDCTFLHVFPSGVRQPEPHVSSEAPGQSDRGAPESAVEEQVEEAPQQQSGGQNTNVASNLAAGYETVDSTHTTHSRGKQFMDSTQRSEVGVLLQEDSLNEGMEGATAAPLGAERTQAFLRSKDLVCGICMDKIYEKPELSDRKFGILSNCTHIFCLKCIKTWRKTRELTANVVKSCPQCRVKSGFYVPHEFWVEGKEKEAVLAAFKKRFSKKTCGFYLRQGRCPFKSDCLYRHDKTLSRPLEISEDTEDLYTSDVLSFLLAMALIDSDEEDDDDNEDEFNFDGKWGLLLRALLSGVYGVQRALGVFHKQQRANSETSLDHFIQTLCKDEVTCPAPNKGPVTLKPLVCLFPTLFKQNLLAFVFHLHHVLPQSTVCRLLECIKQDTCNSWVKSLVTQLERQDRDKEKPLFSSQCGQGLTRLLHQLPRSDVAGGWASYFMQLPHPCLNLDQLYLLQQNKRMRAIFSDEDVVSDEGLSRKEHFITSEGVISSETLDTPPDVPRDTLPENIKIAVLQLKELIESTSEWDQSSANVFNVFNNCDSAQLEVVCNTINLPNVPEHILPKLCSSILALSPDLSFSTASTFIRSLLLEKILGLSEPPSRFLVTTVTSLCSRYPRPTCHALFEPVVEDENIGNLQSDLLNKLVEVCLDSHYKLLALKMTFKVQWTEAVLSIIHCLLDSKLDINEDLFTQLTEQLLNRASHFTKSVKFAKMLLTVLTKYNSNITTVHKHILSTCLTLNDTFLKKSLQAALKRITPF
ncbi:hypothetical protein WMY93_030343 [Mugilogobius chulae]|uniref:RING-type E3 ubiquitin transferase n=1 Tax=Mugilogobius chulae TaxID=88201 RepID=A0AAW0MN41_9GOBI